MDVGNRTMNTPLPPSPFTSPPTPAHLQQIADAKRLGAKIRRAISVAKFSGWTTAIFAVSTVVLSIGSFWGVALGTAMAVISVIEFRGVTELTRLDLNAPRRLALNQLAFGLMLLGYGAFMLVQSMTSPSALSPEVKEFVGKEGEALARSLYSAVYGSVILAAILGPGLTAVYYYTRRRYIEQYLTQTPQWIIDLQRAGMSL
jgi:hypothetical protein